MIIGRASSFIALVLAISLGACASRGDVRELRAGVEQVELIQHGRRPLGFSAGVIDSASFWATYGPTVSARLGGNETVQDWAREGQAEMDARTEHMTLVVDLMYDKHDLAESVNSALLNDLADYWGYAPAADGPIVLDENTAFIDPSTMQLKGVETPADLVLMVEVREIRVTERFSAGNALMSGITLGTGTKQLTVESPVNLLAFRRAPGSADLELVWSRRCGADYTSMDGSAELQRLWDDPAAMKALLDEARDRSIAHCRRVLSHR